MTPRHYINTMMVIFIFNNNINGIFDTVYAILYGLSSLLHSLSVFLEFFRNYFRGSSVG